MMRHSNSFIFSIFIHSILFVLIVLSYKAISAGLQREKKEPLLCIKLASVCAPQETTATPQVKKEIHKKNKKLLKEDVKIVAKAPKKIRKKPKIETFQVVKTVITKKKKEVKKVIKKESVPKPEIVVKPKVAPQVEYIDENIAKIIALLQENLYYPRRARRRGIEGKVMVRFTLSKKAKISKIQVISSNSDILSRGAIQTIKNIDHKLPKPKQSITFNVPISYKLY